jgi:glycosyltransferase involved in cell wall biosynthesis
MVGLAQLFKNIRCWSPHIVQTFLPYSDIVGRTLAAAAGVPVIVSSVRGRYDDKHWWQFVLDRVTVRWVDRVVFNGSSLIPFSVAREGVRKNQIAFIPNGVGIERLHRAHAKSQLLAELGLAPETRLIGVVGRLHPVKRHRDILTAFEKVLTRVPQAGLLIIGDGSLGPSLETYATRMGIRDRVFFLEGRDDMPRVFVALDLYVHGSLHEGMPNAVMEAMAVGTPPVAYDAGWARDILRDNENGWMAEPGNPNALADRIIYALEHPIEARRIGEAAAKHITKSFSREKMTTAFDELYRSLLGEKCGSSFIS